jgi:hypothetical protein
MATLYVTEFATIPNIRGNVGQLAPRPALTTQTVAIGGTSTQSSAFGTTTRYIRVHTDAICSTAVGANPTATTSSERMAADQTEYWAVQPGDKIAVISNT